MGSWHRCVPPCCRHYEASHDEAGSSGPNPCTFWTGIINLRQETQYAIPRAKIYISNSSAGLDPLYDDRDERAGVKFANMDLIGLPWQVVVGPRGLENGMVEIKNRATGDKQEMTPDAVLNKLTAV